MEVEVLFETVKVFGLQEIQDIILRSHMQKILERLYLGDSSRVDNSDLVSTASRCYYTFNRNVRREVLVFASSREIEVEHNLLCCVGLE